MKTKYFALSLLTVAGMTLASCSDDHFDVEGNPNNLVYIYEHAPRVFNATVYHTPTGDYGEVKAAFPAKLQRTLGVDAIIGAQVDTSYVQTYNTEHNAHAVSVPASVLNSIVVKNDTIKAGEYKAAGNIEAEVPNSVLGQLTDSLYVIPLKMTVVSGALTPSEDLGVAYLVVNTTNDYADFSGNTTQSCEIVRTPVGVFGDISASFSVKTLVKMNSAVNFTLRADQSLVETYNNEHNTNYVPLPANLVNALKISSTQVNANETEGNNPVEVSVEQSLAQSLTEPGYVLPLRLVASANGQETVTDKVCYVVVSTYESLVNDKASEVLGTIQSDHSAWTCVSATNLNASELQNAFNTDWNGGWQWTGANLSNGEFVVDFGAEHKVSSFFVSSDVLQNAKVEVSTDNSTWTSLGSTSGHKTVESDGANWMVLYGGVPARYMRFTLSLNKDYWGWNYMSWGYCAMTFNVAFDD